MDPGNGHTQWQRFYITGKLAEIKTQYPRRSEPADAMSPSHQLPRRPVLGEPMLPWVDPNRTAKFGGRSESFIGRAGNVDFRMG